jgi:hypothetical protein
MTSEGISVVARNTVGDAAKAAATYFDSWRAKDFEAFRSVLADDVVFDGPLGHLEGVDDVRRGMEGLGQITTDVVVRKTFTDDTDVLTWFDLHTSVAPPISVANWSHVEGGRITKIQVVFDPRPLTAK